MVEFYLCVMDQAKKTEFKQLLEERIAKTVQKIAGYEEMAEPIAPENSIGRVSRMDAINNKSVVDAALRTAKEKLSALKSMLNKINDADFGKCDRCGEAIPDKRLILMPESKFCVRCAS